MIDPAFAHALRRATRTAQWRRWAKRAGIIGILAAVPGGFLAAIPLLVRWSTQRWHRRI